MEESNNKLIKECQICEYKKDIKNKVIDNHYIIDGYVYSFKKDLQKGNISLRCINRKNCGALLTLNKKDLIEKIEGKIQSFTYYLNREHKCNGLKELKKEAKNVQSETEIINAAKTIIFQNKEKSLGWHINNLKNLNIILSDNKIKRIVYDIKDSFFPKDEDFLKNISMIRITFDSNNSQLKENNFCYEYKKILNPDYHFREEKYIIYTSIFQINKLASSELIFIDATFRTSPRNYYQLLNIICKDVQSGRNIPVIHIPMSHKSTYLYENVFESIERISNDLNISLNMKKKTCITDFEIGLRKVLRNKFKGIKLRGCFFHYVKALWSKAKKLGLCSNKKISKTKLIIFGLKLLTLQNRDNQKNMLNKIKEFINDMDDNNFYKKYINYYEKNLV